MPTPEAVREECYSRLLWSAYDGLAKFYEANPHLLGDARMVRAYEESINGMKVVISILNEYQITRKPIGMTGAIIIPSNIEGLKGGPDEPK